MPKKETFDDLVAEGRGIISLGIKQAVYEGLAPSLRNIFDELVDEDGYYQCIITSFTEAAYLTANITEINIFCGRIKIGIVLKEIIKCDDGINAHFLVQRHCLKCEERALCGEWRNGIGNCERIRKKQERLLAIDGEIPAKPTLHKIITYWGYKVGDIIRRKGEAGASMITAIRDNTHEGCVFAFGEWIKDLTQYELVQRDSWERWG